VTGKSFRVSDLLGVGHFVHDRDFVHDWIPDDTASAPEIPLKTLSSLITHHRFSAKAQFHYGFVIFKAGGI
jgi:hypothetical protein